MGSPKTAFLNQIKRKKGQGDLTRSQKIYNKKQRRARIRVENAIAQLKKYQILTQTYRHFREKYNSAVVSGYFAKGLKYSVSPTTRTIPESL